MKKILVIISLILPLKALSQYTNPEIFKCNKVSKAKSEIIQYYNPLLDKYDIHFVKLDLEVSNRTTYVSGNAIIEAKVVNNIDTLIFDLHQSMIIDSVFINNKKVSVSHVNNTIRYFFDSPLNAGDNFKANIHYHGLPSINGGGVVNAFSANWNKYVTWTLSESFHAFEWWPCKQVLSDKIDSTHIYLTCDSNCKAGSNGLLKRTINLPYNKKRYEWKSHYPINYYLISFAVSEYHDYSIYAYPENGDSVLIQNFIYNTNGCLPYYKPGIDNTAELIELFSEKFGLYPFANEKYGHCLTELGGGMEHQTMTTIGNFSYLLVAHELGHMWFGDYVTCASWQDIWINEGFASYTEYVALENLVSLQDAKGLMSYAHSLALEEPQGSVYIPFDDAFDESRIFNYALSYEKGSAILHMIRHEINNDELFFSIIRDYLQQFADSVATGDDFKNTLELKTGDDFDPFFNQWYYGKGFPRFDIEYAQLSDTLILLVNESTSSAETPLFQVHVDYKITYPQGDTTVRFYQSKNVETFNIAFNKEITGIEVDPDNWMLNEPGSIKKYNNNQPVFKIIPNPANEELTLNFNFSLNNEEKQIEFFDINGQLLYTFKTRKNTVPINLSSLKNGMYIIKSKTQDNSYTQKFIKQ